MTENKQQQQQEEERRYFIKFNNNNVIWEIIHEHEGRQITCYNRGWGEIGKNRNNNFTYKYVIDEDKMGNNIS